MSNTHIRRDIEGTSYSFEEALTPFLEELSNRVQAMRRAGKLSNDTLAQIRKFFRLKNIYHSNAIEGNILDIGETRQVVEQGLTLTGKPLKDQAEARNLDHALDFLEDLASSSNQSITEGDIRQIHSFVLQEIHEEAGSYRTRPVAISGSKYKTPGPESIAPEMQALGQWLSTVSEVKAQHGVFEAILYAAAAHAWLVYIHPFIDGNGRTARLLMNLILMRYGYPIAIITKEDRLRYYDALEESQDGGDLTSFLTLVAECINESVEEYEEALERQSEEQEFYAALAKRFSTKEETRAQNEYAVWKNAMELLRSYFRKAAELLDNQIGISVKLQEFDILAFEKYFSLRQGESAKRTWFFRIDFLLGEHSARYLFFFGSPSYLLRETTDVTLHLSREEPPKSFHYERLDSRNISRTPQMVEVGYRANLERFAIRTKSGTVQQDKVEKICRQFFEEVSKIHA